VLAGGQQGIPVGGGWGGNADRATVEKKGGLEKIKRLWKRSMIKHTQVKTGRKITGGRKKQGIKRVQ